MGVDIAVIKLNKISKDKLLNRKIEMENQVMENEIVKTLTQPQLNLT